MLDAASPLTPSNDDAAQTAENLRAYIGSLPADVQPVVKQGLLEYGYKTDPAFWARRVLGFNLEDWQQTLVKRPAGSRNLYLLSRQRGKSESTSISIAWELLYGKPGSTSLCVAPTQKQAGELILRCRKHLVKAGAVLAADNAFSLRLKNGSRVQALPGDGDGGGLRGFSCDGILVFDEAARISRITYEACMPFVVRHTATARVYALTSAWKREGWFWDLWSSEDCGWNKYESNIYESPYFTPEQIAVERRSMPASTFAREYENVWDSEGSAWLSVDAIDAAFGALTTPTPDEPAEDPVSAITPAIKNPFEQTGVRF
jgi:hypothetical protein